MQFEGNADIHVFPLDTARLLQDYCRSFQRIFPDSSRCVAPQLLFVTTSKSKGASYGPVTCADSFDKFATD
jgi:hypothetical protein